MSFYQVQAFTPSSEQIEQFKNLPKEEQERLAKKAGVSLPATEVQSKSRLVPQEEETQSVVVEPTAAKDVPASENIEAEAAKTTDAIEIKEYVEEKVAKQELKQFGYDLFSGVPSTFAPTTDIPVPSNYVLGPGDIIVVQLYGKESSTHELEISREGVIQFPEIGPITVATLSFVEAKELIKQTVQEQMIGIKSSITMGRLRTMRVFVLGDVNRPGSYTVSSLSTMINALFVSGGISKIGSLRNVQLKRNGEIISTLDLYELLLKGDTSNDSRLLPGDVIFVPPIGATVGVNGDIKRPAIYEINGEQTAEEIIELAGGYLATAYPKVSRIERIDHNGMRTVVDVDLTSLDGKNKAINNGDILQVFSVLDTVENVVLLHGHVKRPGGVSWRKGMRISDVVASIPDMLPNPDLNFALIKREILPERSVKVLRVHLGRALQSKGSEFDLKLEPRDELFVFGYQDNRSAQLDKINQALINQTMGTNYPAVVTIEGNVRQPGAYPIYGGMSLQGLIDASLGYKPDTDLNYVVIERRMKNEAKVKAMVVRLDHPVDNFLIEPLDKVYLFNLVDNRPQILSAFVDKLKSQATYNEYPEIVTIQGSVEIPGVYPHYPRMTIQDLVNAARGVAAETDLDHAVLVRKIPNNSAIKTLLITLKDRESLATKLEPADMLYLFDIDGDRAEVLTEVVAKLRQQVGAQELVPSVEIDGLINKPGEYPLSSSMSVMDLVGLAGGLSYAAYDLDAEITRVLVEENREKRYEHFTFSLQNTSETDAMLLHPEDRILIKRKPNWGSAATVILSGEFRFPGSYQIKQGEMLSQVMERAGGITEHAYSDGAVFTRLELRELEEKRLRDLESQLEKELTSSSLQEEDIGKQKPDTVQADRLLKQLKETKATGRMVINLPSVLGGNSEADIILKEGDTLFLPSQMQSVTVIGEVQHPTSHLLQRGRGVNEYIAQSGGFTYKADKGRVYVVKANGQVIQPKGKKWFFASNSDVSPGDTIVVPLDADRISSLKLWTDVTQIIYQVGLGAAAVASF